MFCMTGCCAVTLTEFARKVLAVLVSILHCVQAMTGIFAVLFGIYISSVLETFGMIINLHRKSSFDYLWVATGVLLMLVHGTLAVVCSRMVSPATRNTQLKPWLYVVVFTMQLPYVVLTLALAIALSFHDNHITKAFQSGLTHAMNTYQEMDLWKQELDQLQITYRCCGAGGPSDWYNIRWLPEKYFDSVGYLLRLGYL